MALNHFVSADNLVRLDAICKRYGVLPSEYVGIDDRYEAFCFDEAVALAALDAERKAWEEWREREGLGDDMPRHRARTRPTSATIKGPQGALTMQGWIPIRRTKSA